MKRVPQRLRNEDNSTEFDYIPLSMPEEFQKFINLTLTNCKTNVRLSRWCSDSDKHFCLNIQRDIETLKAVLTLLDEDRSITLDKCKQISAKNASK